MKLHFNSWTKDIEQGPYAALLQEMSEADRRRLAYLPKEDSQKATAMFLDKKIQEKAYALLAKENLDILTFQKYRQAITRHAYFYLVSTQSGQARLFFPQYQKGAIAPDEVSLSVSMRLDATQSNMQESMLQAFLLRLEALKIEIISVDEKGDRVMIHCYHKDWGQTKLTLSLDPRIVDDVEVFSELGALKDQSLHNLLKDEVSEEKTIQQERTSLKQNETAPVSQGDTNLKEKVALAGVALLTPSMVTNVSKEQESQENMQEILRQTKMTNLVVPRPPKLASKTRTVKEEQEAQFSQHAKANMRQFAAKKAAPVAKKAAEKNKQQSAFRQEMKQQATSWMLAGGLGAGVVGSGSLLTLIMN